MHLLPLLLILQTIKASASKTSCSCAPTKYSFRLSLSNSQDCTNDIADNTGIKQSLCFIEDSVSLPSLKTMKNMVDRSGGPFGSSRNNATTSYSNNQEEVRRQRSLQASIDEVISIQFLEFDTSDSLNVIYTDDTYVSTSLGDGDEFTFYSSSATENDVEVGGASLILYGRSSNSNDGGDVVRNRFFWLYDGCEGAWGGVEEGDSIGWVTVDEIAGPYPKNCPAVPEVSPTISPRTEEPAPTAEPGGNVDWVTPFPTPSGDQEGSDDASFGGTDDTAGSTNDDEDESDDRNTDDYGSFGGTDDTAGSTNDDEDESDDGNTDDYGPPSSSKSTKTNKPYHRPEGYIDVASGGKTHKHPYDNWSHDEGSKSAKAFGKSGKNGKAFGKSLKGGGNSIDDDDDYPHAPRLFSESSHNGENVR